MKHLRAMKSVNENGRCEKSASLPTGSYIQHERNCVSLPDQPPVRDSGADVGHFNIVVWVV